MIIQHSQPKNFPIKYSPSFQSKVKFGGELMQDTVELSTKLSTKSAVGCGIGSIIGGLLGYKQQEQIDDFQKCLELKDSDNFQAYRESLCKFFENNNYDKSFVEEIKKVSNNYSMNFEFDIFVNHLLLSDNISEDVVKKIKNRDFSPELDNFLNRREINDSNFVIPILKLSSQTDTLPEIIEIKKELKNDFGLENLFFNNDLDFAKSCQKVFKILKEKEIPYSGTIIATDRFDAGGINLESSDGNCIVVNHNYWQCGDMPTTQLILHEILHSLQPRTLEFRLKSVPHSFENVIAGISNYANGNNACEIHCELYVKKLLEGLSAKEEELFNFLGGTFLK